MSRNRLLGLLVSALGLLATSIVPSQPALAMDASMAAPGDPSLIVLVTAEQSLIDLTNADRAANGVAPLQFDADTLAIARERAESQLGPQHLDHYDAAGQLIFAQLLGQANLGYGLAGENLARAASRDANVTVRVEQALMQSPEHRRNILEKTFRRVAIGAATDATTGQITFAEVYRD
jgi:uncharacterized protein YkwD